MPGHLSTPYESWESDNKVAPQGQAQEPADACECVVPTLSPNSTPRGPNVNQAEKGILADTHSLQTPTEFKGATIPTSAMSKYPSIVLGLCRGSRLRSQVSLFIQWHTLSLPGGQQWKGQHCPGVKRRLWELCCIQAVWTRLIIPISRRLPFPF